MRDQRLDKLARVLVEYSVGIKPGQLVRLAGPVVGTPLLEALYEAVLRAGGHPFIKCTPDNAQDIFFAAANDEQLQYVSPLAKFEIEKIDASIGLWADTNTKSLSQVDPRKQKLASAARKPIMEIFMNRAASKSLRWTGTLYPTYASAQDAEMSLAEYEDFVFNAGHLNKDDPIAEWRKIEASQQKVVDYLNGKKHVHFQTSGGTDLHVNVEGMTWINCCGHENFPDGEVFTGPNLKAKDGGVNGIVHYSFPAVHHGREVHDIVFTFEKGKVVDAKASKNLEFLLNMLDQDAGARFMGEIAIGTNYQITNYSKNTLFDEKIGGTFHAAVGAGYPETGNSNSSGLHWDMVCDMRSTSGGGGTITVDGQVIQRDGKFVFPGWPGV
ncbi:MAG: aminopeptidase [Phycisphaeraceae bacterium]|nr:aminopeptidase [Phycisphaeraceae bacterium]